MTNRSEKSLALYQTARELMPKGVSSNARFWGEGKNLYVSKAKGAYLWDVDGNQYIDYRLAFGPIILGYAYDEVDAQVWSVIQNGVGSGLGSELEIRAARRVVTMCPGVEKLRFVNSGTEATMHALRVARAYTGREKILKFEGAYHGGLDYVLFSTYAPPETYGNRMSPIAIPASSGIPRALRDLIVTVPFNDRDALEQALRNVGHELAAIIMEPMLGNYGSVEPQPGFLEFIRSKCNQYETLLILDEVKTGFRVARGGAQELYGVRADLVTYAKSMGNGYPVAAYGGHREIMDIVGDGVSQGGTFSGNSLAVAAADATLSILESQPVLETIAQNGQRLQEGIKAIFRKAGISMIISGYPSIFGVAIGAEEIVDARDWAHTDRDYYQKFAAGLLERGVLIDHDPREPWCLCYSHSQVDVDHTLGAMDEVVASLKR
jgi:glutamate-1-semialdehyde 2,1-aminomutase